MDEDQPIDVTGVPNSIGGVQIFQTNNVIQGESITLSLEDAAQLIFQQQELQGDGDGSLQSGTYQIITQQLGGGTSNQISIIHAGNTDQLQGLDFGCQNIFLQQPTGDSEQTSPQIIQLPDSLTTPHSVADQSATVLSAIQNESDQFIPQHESCDTQENSETIEDDSDQIGDELSVDQPGHVFEMINHPVPKSDGNLGKEGIDENEKNPLEITDTSFVNPNEPKETVIEIIRTDPIVAPESHVEESIKEENDMSEYDLAEQTDGSISDGHTEMETTAMLDETDTVQKDDKDDIVTKGVIDGKIVGKTKPTKQPDLTKPIKVFNNMEVVVGKKKCMLKVNPETGQLCAYPLISSTATGKKRGRPRKSETQQSSPTGQPVVAEKEQTNSAAEGLLELSNTGPDGIRRSGRAKKKASVLEDYEMLEVSSDDDAAADNAEDEVLPTGAVRKRKSQALRDLKEGINPVALIPSYQPVKRGRGRPRRYPRPEDTPTTSQIPTMIIPSGDGQSVMMAPIQGLTNLEEFQKQMNLLVNYQQQQPIQPNPPLQEVVNDGTQFLNKPVMNPIPEPDVTLSGNQDNKSIDNPLIEVVNSGVLDAGSDVDNVPITDETNGESGLTTGLIMTVDGDLPESLTTDTVDEQPKSTENTGPTIIQIPETLLPMFVQKKDPQKIGLKASNSELEKLKCSKCEFQAYYDQQYQRHITEHHSDDVIKCKCCPFRAFEKETIIEHFKQTHPRCICPHCDHMAEHAYIIKRHMMRHNQIGCKCEICGKVYKDQYVMKMHVKMIHLPAEVLFECTVCSKKFTRKAHLKRHLRIHDPQKPFKCDKCPYRGCEKSDISKHMLIHEEPKHVCEVCGKAFRHLKNKELHMKRHSGQRDYKCGVCDFYGYTFTDIRKHIERKHTNTKAHICDKCGSAFKSEALLRIHRAQQCDVFMIEQALSIATTDGGTSQATIQIPSNFPLDGQSITIDGQSMVINDGGQLKIESSLPDDAISLTADQLQAVVSQSQISDGTHQQVELIREIGVDQDQYADGVGLSGDDETIEGEIDEAMDEDEHGINEQIQGIGDEVIDETDDGKVNQQILQMVTGFNS